MARNQAAVQVVESNDDPSNIELGMDLFAKQALPVVGGVEFTTKCQFQEEVQVLWALCRNAVLQVPHGLVSITNINQYIISLIHIDTSFPAPKSATLDFY